MVPTLVESFNILCIAEGGCDQKASYMVKYTLYKNEGIFYAKIHVKCILIAI